MIPAVSSSHCRLCDSELVTTTENVRRTTRLIPHNPNTQCRQIVSSGSPNTPISRWDSVLEVFNTTADCACKSPRGTPSPESPSRNAYATPGRSTRSIHPVKIAGGWPHQFGCTMTIPSASATSEQYRSISRGNRASRENSAYGKIASNPSAYKSCIVVVCPFALSVSAALRAIA